MRKLNIRPYLRRAMAATFAGILAASLSVSAFAAGTTCPICGIPGCTCCTSANSVVPTAADFSDAPDTSPFYTGIMYCAEKGIVGGYSDGTFRPANTVTRANFAVMLSRAFYADDVAKYSTESNLKYGYSMPSFVALNYKNLLTNTSFDTIEKFIKPEVVNLGISRYDMAQLMTNIMNEKGFAASSAEKNAVISQIADYSEIPSQYKDAVTNVYALGIIGGFSNGTFGGSGTMTRGQGAIVIYRMVQKSDSGSITNPGTDPEAPVDPSTGEQTCLCKSIYGYCPCKGETKPSGNTGTGTGTKPETPSTTKTLIDGSAITEANVMRLMEARVAEWGNKPWGTPSGPNGTPTSKPYPLGETSDVRVTIQTYKNIQTHRYGTSCTSGCGGWATYLSDAAFGTTGFPLRKVASVDDIRAGDIIVNLTNGELNHIAIASGKENVRNFGSYTVTCLGCYESNAGAVPGHSANYIDPSRAEWTTNYDSATAAVSQVVYTRYPD